MNWSELDAILAHQEPAAQALLARVEPVARSRLSDLSKQCLRVPIDQRPKAATLLEPFEENRRIKAKSAARNLRDGSHPALTESHERNPDDPLIADCGHLGDGPIQQGGDKRDHPVSRKVNGIDGFAGFKQQRSGVEADVACHLQQLPSFREWESAENPVLTLGAAVGAACLLGLIHRSCRSECRSGRVSRVK